ncbi:MAG: hypothetical protein KDE26_12060, partial [Bacteroidetes bacterium]|nr:hypothetical protein [Bacteroidota bacterium]
MRTYIIFLTLICIALEWSCRKPLDIDFCEDYFSAFAVAQPAIYETYPGYKMARFAGDSVGTIFSIKEKQSKSQVVKYRIENKKTKVIYEQKDQIQVFDYNTSGDMAFIHKQKLFVLPKGESNSIEVPFPEDIGFVKWNGEKLICQIDQGVLVQLDQQGNLSHKWNLLTRATDYWANDSILIIANIDSITAYSLPDLNYQWSFQTRPYFENLDNVIFLSEHTISLAGIGNTANGLSKVIFSTPDQVYVYDVNSKEVMSLWEKMECYILEPGISISPDGNQIVVTISTIYSITQKQFGLMLLD